MADIVSFKNFTYYKDALPEDHTVSGEALEAEGLTWNQEVTQ